MGNFFENLDSQFPVGLPAVSRLISSYITAGGDIFDRMGFLNFKEKNINNSELLINNVGDGRIPNSLPIEFFKDPALLRFFLPTGFQQERFFRSSGTTGQQQSLSPFSRLGLELYRVQALTGFYAMLAKKFPAFDDRKIKSIPGFSLIPDSDAWPTSSLAQMVTWVSAHSKVTFIGDSDAAELRAAAKPVWIFGTAFHFVNLIDSGFKTQLPVGSVVIETGGTKGRSRSVARDELFTLLESAFSLPRESIVSEYGMCELATQAYDLAIEHGTRSFQFPVWVEAGVLTKTGEVVASGQGALVIQDPLRADLPQWIRTEDIVELNDGVFHILRRSRSAPLKGCSLLAEKEQIPSNVSDSIHGKVAPAQTADPEKALERATKVLSICDQLLADPDVLIAFGREFGGTRLAEFACDDLRRSIPPSAEALLLAAETALRERSEREHAWTIIAPNNHSLAAIHPVLLAYVAGLDVVVRLPAHFHSADHFLSRLLDALAIEKLQPSHHIRSATDVYKNGKVLIFGSDATLKELVQTIPQRISGFGDSVAISCGDLDDVKKHTAAIVRDFFSLRQSGCMSARAFVLHSRSADDLSTVVRLLAQDAESYSNLLSVDDIAAIDGERTRIELLTCTSTLRSNKKNTPLVAGIPDSSHLKSTDILAKKAFVIPVIALPSPNWSTFVNHLKLAFSGGLKVGLCLVSSAKLNDFKFDKSCKNTSSFQSFRSFGQSQSPVFSGMHDGRPLFSTNL